MNKIRGYGSSFNLGHKALDRLFSGPIVMQEKIDGSQFSFGLRNGELFCRSRNQQIDMEDAGMFQLAVDTIEDLDALGWIVEGYTYRGEFLMKPKHNTLVYDRVPKRNIILFDIDKGDQDYMIGGELVDEAERMDLEVVPTWYPVEKPKIEDLEKRIEKKSVLGNVAIEGLVFKNYAEYGPDKKVLMGKYVSDKFREKHEGDWKKRNPGDKGFVKMLAEQYATEARWAKAVQHLGESGELLGEMKDIPALLKEVNRDVLDECEEEIRQKLFKHFWRQISKQLTRGLPEWYKEKLAQEMLE